MSIVLGLDLGTQSIKAALTDTELGILATAGHEYQVLMPLPGYAEQKPEAWWKGCLHVLQVLRDAERDAFEQISAIGVTGQMHGLVALKEDLKPAYPAIIWLDQRSGAQIDQIYALCGYGTLAEHLQNLISPGFALPSLLWLREEQPDVYRTVRHIICPKDYIRLRLTGELGCEPTDASGTCMYDIAEGKWYASMLDKLGLDASLLPPCSDSMSFAGTVTEEAHRETGLSAGIPVIYGCSDESALLLGNGLCQPGTIVANIGTGATVSALSLTDRYDPKLRTHTFCNVSDSYAVFGAILGGGINMRWLRDSILSGYTYEELSLLAESVPPGAEGVLFLPYTGGERTPHMDPSATGMFFGLRLGHDRNHLVRAVMEGICFAMRDCLAIVEGLGIPGNSVTASGGGARSRVWMQMMADILQREVRVTAVPEQASLGACILAGTASGAFASVEDGCDRLVTYADRTYSPKPEAAERCSELYSVYQELYRVNAPIMHRALEIVLKSDAADDA